VRNPISKLSLVISKELVREPTGGNSVPWVHQENPDRKHKRNWDQATPGFVEEKGEIVGKCPATLTTERAEELLNSGIPYTPPR
jgi:hypothetical protein